MVTKVPLSINIPVYNEKENIKESLENTATMVNIPHEVLVVLVGTYRLYHRGIKFISTPPKSIKDVADFAKAKTSRNASFLVNPRRGSGWEIFRALSERSVLVTWKDGSAMLWDRSFVKQWSERLKSLGFDIMQ